MSYEKAYAHLAAFGLEDRIKLFEVSSATVLLAAEAVGTTPERIAKSISLLQGENAVLVIAAGDAKIDNRKYKDTFHTKARLIGFDDVERLVGHAPGGVCPFGVNEGVKVYLDESLKRFDIVYPAAGTSQSAVELTVEELERASCSLGWVDVCSIPE